MNSNPISITRKAGLRTLLLSVAAASMLAFGASSASASVQLNWSQTNVYANGCSASGVNCTWLGYLTRPGPAGPAGVVSPIAPAAGPTIDPTSTKGPTSVWTFDAVAGSLNTRTLAGQFSFDGGISFAGSAHGISQTIEDPRIVLNGDGTGKFFASGDKADNVTPAGPPPGTSNDPYDQTESVFDLDASQADFTLNFDGSQTFGPLIPSITTTGYSYPTNASYAAGKGPERSPNTFGTFSITIPAAAGPQGPAGNDGAPGAAGLPGAIGPVGPVGPAGKNATVKTIKLKKASFGKKAVVAKITRKGKTYGYAEIKGKKAKLTYVGTLKGKYVLKSITGKSRKATISIR